MYLQEVTVQVPLFSGTVVEDYITSSFMDMHINCLLKVYLIRRNKDRYKGKCICTAGSTGPNFQMGIHFLLIKINFVTKLTILSSYK